MRAWAELLRVSALFSVPGDALAGAAALGARPNRGTALAVGASLCLYGAGMALNDWADRDEDAADRPHRPIPSGRISPPAALAAAGALTAAGLALAARAGRPALRVGSALGATVWSYDLHFKHTVAGPAAMSAARGLDLMLGAVATGGVRPGGAASGGVVPGAGARGLRSDGAAGVGVVAAALPSAVVLAAHTYAVTVVSRHEAQGGSTAAPLAALAATLGLGALASRTPRPVFAPRSVRAELRGVPALPSPARGSAGLPLTPARLLAATYIRTAAKPLLHAALNPSPPLTQRAVGGGIRAMIPLQAALAARTGAGATALAVMGLVPLARKLARKVSPT
ncbi:UbiA family prenyltransferase [Streptomyces sp. NBC_00210]|uniref:SCO3242 family prenyltransferase n=1 Tax=unclassified Streptomyces TaxID=2593676 RepID=UPI00324A05E7